MDAPGGLSLLCFLGGDFGSDSPGCHFRGVPATKYKRKLVEYHFPKKYNFPNYLNITLGSIWGDVAGYGVDMGWGMGMVVKYNKIYKNIAESAKI